MPNGGRRCRCASLRVRNAHPAGDRPRTGCSVVADLTDRDPPDVRAGSPSRRRALTMKLECGRLTAERRVVRDDLMYLLRDTPRGSDRPRAGSLRVARGRTSAGPTYPREVAGMRVVRELDRYRPAVVDSSTAPGRDLLVVRSGRYEKVPWVTCIVVLLRPASRRRRRRRRVGRLVVEADVAPHIECGTQRRSTSGRGAENLRPFSEVVAPLVARLDHELDGDAVRGRAGGDTHRVADRAAAELEDRRPRQGSAGADASVPRGCRPRRPASRRASSPSPGRSRCRARGPRGTKPSRRMS